MAQATANKTYKNFSKGLITEASLLTFPENSSTDELNTVIFRKGNRSRRFGFAYEVDAILSPFVNVDPDDRIREYRWDGVANKPGLVFLAMQIGATLRFFDLSVTPTSAGLKSFFVNLNDFAVPNTIDVGHYSVSIVGGKGYLYVSGEKVEPFYVEYDPDTDTIETKKIYIQVRDFKGIDDGYANDDEPSTLTSEHEYNLLNQGWFNPANDGTSGDTVETYDPYGNQVLYTPPDKKPIDDYFTATTRYPGNNKQWWLGKSTVDDGTYDIGDFNPAQLEKTYYGNTRAPRGHFITNAFYVDRSAVSGIAGLPVDITVDRPSAISFVTSRIWYACNNTIYYSQVLDDVKKAGLCMQEADPTSEMISDLVDTDGGVIPIPEMARAVALVPSGSGILVFATNGTWYVGGTQAGFSATDNSVSKVSKYGTNSPDSIVEDGLGRIYYWSEVGIHRLEPKSGLFGSMDGAYDIKNLTEETIQTLYNSIYFTNGQHVKGIFDPATSTIQWLYKANENLERTNAYNGIINFDITLEAFYPWLVSGVDNYISGVFLTPTLNIVENPTTSQASVRNNYIKYVVFGPSGSMAFGLFRDTGFIDWGANSYESYLETGYELLEDAMRKKQTPWIFVFFRRTEENVYDDGDDLATDKPSSCYLQTKWDWSDSSVSGKWSTRVQTYRHRRMPTLDGPGVFDTGYPIVVSRNKVRGSGKSIQFRFENTESGSDFDLLGWAVNYKGATIP